MASPCGTFTGSSLADLVRNNVVVGGLGGLHLLTILNTSSCVNARSKSALGDADLLGCFVIPLGDVSLTD